MCCHLVTRKPLFWRSLLLGHLFRGQTVVRKDIVDGGYSCLSCACEFQQGSASPVINRNQREASMTVEAASCDFCHEADDRSLSEGEYMDRDREIVSVTLCDPCWADTGVCETCEIRTHHNIIEGIIRPDDPTDTLSHCGRQQCAIDAYESLGLPVPPEYLN